MYKIRFIVAMPSRHQVVARPNKGIPLAKSIPPPHTHPLTHNTEWGVWGVGFFARCHVFTRWSPMVTRGRRTTCFCLLFLRANEATDNGGPVGHYLTGRLKLRKIEPHMPKREISHPVCILCSR